MMEKKKEEENGKDERKVTASREESGRGRYELHRMRTGWSNHFLLPVIQRQREGEDE